MKDKYGREINYLRVSITDRCNLRCSYCMPGEGVALKDPGEILSFEEIIRVIQAAVARGVTRVRITGGEPLTRDGVTDLVRMVGGTEGITDLSMTTNGVLLSAYAVKLKEAGLDRVNVSLDTLKEDKYLSLTGRDALSDVLEGIDAARSAGLLPVKVNVVVIKGLNDDEVVSFVEFAAERDITVRFIEFMPARGKLDWSASKVVKTDRVMKICSESFDMTPAAMPGAGPAGYLEISGKRSVVGFISPFDSHFCGKCNRLRLTADGKLVSCLHDGREGLDLKPALRDKTSEGSLTDLFEKAVDIKPDRHKMSLNGKQSGRSMSGIGG